MADAGPVAQFPILDREAARSFLQYLDPDAEQFTFQTFTDSEQRKSTYQKRPETGQPIDPLARVLHGTLDQHWAALVDASRQGAGVFVVINKTTLKGRRSGDGIRAVRAHFSDCDGVPKDTIKAALSLLTLMPHIITQTSTGKYHLFWCVDDAPLTDFAGTQKKLATLFGSDPHVFDLPRVMRLPGFPHQKDGSAGELVRVLYLHVNDPDALGAVARELQHRDLKDYSAQDPAPRTTAKARMIEAAGSELQRWMLDADVLRGHKLVAVDKIMPFIPHDIDRRHRGNLRTDIADVLRRKFNGVPVRNQIRPDGKNGGKLRVWALGKDAETTAALPADQLAEIWRAEYD